MTSKKKKKGDDYYAPMSPEMKKMREKLGKVIAEEKEVLENKDLLKTYQKQIENSLMSYRAFRKKIDTTKIEVHPQNEQVSRIEKSIQKIIGNS